MESRHSLALLVCVLLAASCGNDGAREPDLYFRMDDTIHLPAGQDGRDSPDASIPGPDGTGDLVGTGPDGGADAACTPQCANKTCGPDGCGGQCGSCAPGSTCDANGICVPEECTPQCANKTCGPDGCGGSCGSCAPGSTCDANGICQETCVPDCAGKECGTDGCSGSCGSCPDITPDCVNGTCVGGCIPDCTGKECGSDGCDGSCGTCQAPESCNPQGQCENLSCPVQGTLACNQVHSGDNTGLANNYPSYGCGFDASGPEALFQFSSPTRVWVKVTKTEPAADKNDLYVLYGDCNPDICVDNDGDEVFFTAAPATGYMVSVDGYQGAYGPFTLDVLCIDAGDCPDGKIPGCGGQCGWGHWLGDGMCSAVFDCAELNFDEGDCQ